MLNIEKEAKTWMKKKEGKMPSKLIIKMKIGYDYKFIILLIHLYLILILLLFF
tara:strand:+ start:339 stop:497 length:159 start_codon:yes stop_codon:yes gene_type:complete